MRCPPLLIAALLGCSSGGGIKSDGSMNDGPANDTTVTSDGGTDTTGQVGVLDCAWLEGPNNCWHSTFAPATACLPPTSSTGTLSADSRTCTYASGEVVMFTAPVVLPIPTDMRWNFTITGAGGQPCLHYQDDTGGFTVVVGGQTFRDRFLPANGLAFTCPDGTVVQADDAYPLVTCPVGGAMELPGAFWTSNDTSVSFGMTGTPTLSTLLFSCSKP